MIRLRVEVAEGRFEEVEIVHLSGEGSGSVRAGGKWLDLHEVRMERLVEGEEWVEA